jgi:hypothetical protein
MYQRIVCFKFKPGVTGDAIQQHMDDFAALKDAIPQIVAYSGGRTVVHGDASDAYDTLHYMTFDSLDAIDGYFAHEAHRRFIDANKAHWANVLVLNAPLG